MNVAHGHHHGCCGPVAAAYPDGDPVALMERALRGDGELSRFLRENGWNGDCPMEPRAATPRQRKAEPSEPRRGATPPPSRQRQRRGAAFSLDETSFPCRRVPEGGTWAAASTSISPHEQCRPEAGLPASGLPPIGHGASPRPPPAEVPRLTQAQPAAQPAGQPSSPEMPRGVGSGQLLHTPSPPDCGRPAHDSGSPRSCHISADGSARGAGRRDSFASRVDAAEAQLFSLLGESGEGGGGAGCRRGGCRHHSPAAAAVAAYSSPSPPAAAAGSRTVGRRRTTDDSAVHTLPRRGGGMGSDGAEPREDPEEHLTLDERTSPGTASGAPSPLSRRRASTLTAAEPAPPPEAGRATDHLSSEKRVLARRDSGGGVEAAGLAALVSNHAPESSRSPRARRASTLSPRLSGGVYNRRRAVGHAAPHQQSHAAAALSAAREVGWTLKAHLENLDQRFSDSIAKPQSETTAEAVLPAIMKATPRPEFAAAVPPMHRGASRSTPRRTARCAEPHARAATRSGSASVWRPLPSPCRGRGLTF